MRTIIAGSRTYFDYTELCSIMRDLPWVPSTIVCGCAKGVDTLGEQWGKEHSIPIEYYPADWKTLGRGAGHIRNEIMAKNAEALVALWVDGSPGTKNMISLSQKYQLTTHIVEIFTFDDFL